MTIPTSYLSSISNTLFLYKFDGNSNDSSGNARHLTLENGTERYTEIGNGSSLVGAYFDFATNYIYSTYEAAVGKYGDITVQGIISPHIYIASGTPVNQGIVTHGTSNASDSNSANNWPWGIMYTNAVASGRANTFLHFSESGSGTDAVIDYLCVPPHRTPSMFHYIRKNGFITFAVNDRRGAVFENTNATTTPTGGANTRLRVGLDPGGAGTPAAYFCGVLASIRGLDYARDLLDCYDDAYACGFGSPAPTPEIYLGVYDEDEPTISDRVPAPGATSVLRDADISFTLDDADDGVDTSSVTIEVDFGDGAGYQLAYSNETFQAGFSGTATENAGAIDYVVSHSVDFESDLTITVRVRADDLAPTPNSLESVWSFGVEDFAAPYLTDQAPAPDETGVRVTRDTELRIDDAGSLVDLTTVVIQVAIGDGSFVTAYTGSAFQTGFSGTVTGPTGNGYDFRIDPDDTWPAFTIISVRVVAEDVLGFALDETYQFTTASLVQWTPHTATTNGGGAVVFNTGYGTLTTIHNRTLTTTTAPADWGTGGTGTVTPTRRGLLLRGTTAALTSDDDFLYYDAALDVQLLAPGAGTMTDVLTFGQPAANMTATLVRTADGGLWVRGLVDTTEGTVALADARTATLRVVRGPTYGYVLVGTRGRRNAWTAETLVCSAPLSSTTEAPLQITLAGSDATAYCRNLAVGHAASIGDQLVRLTGQQDAALSGIIPAAQAAGVATVRFWGPSSVAADTAGFRYTTPTRALLPSSVRTSKIVIDD